MSSQSLVHAAQVLRAEINGSEQICTVLGPGLFLCFITCLSKDSLCSHLCEGGYVLPAICLSVC